MDARRRDRPGGHGHSAARRRPARLADEGRLARSPTLAGARPLSGATLPGLKADYEAPAREYDDWVYGTGLFAERHRPGWHEEREGMQDAVAAMPAARTLDIACGTGWLTQHLRGGVGGLGLAAGRR